MAESGASSAAYGSELSAVYASIGEVECEAIELVVGSGVALASDARWDSYNAVGSEVVCGSVSSSALVSVSDVDEYSVVISVRAANALATVVIRSECYAAHGEAATGVGECSEAVSVNEAGCKGAASSV